VCVVRDQSCVRTKFSVAFRLLEKVLVNGPDTHPVFRWLRLKGGDEGAITCAPLLMSHES